MRRNHVSGWVLIAVGLFFLASNLGFMNSSLGFLEINLKAFFKTWWPVIPLVIGIGALLRKK